MIHQMAPHNDGCVHHFSAGVIQPTKISDEGKPVPIEHVAELLESLQASEQNPRESDSDWKQANSAIV